jgi:hypothetical protein
MNVSWAENGQYATDIFTTEAVRLISTHDTSRPLFLDVSHLAVHSARDTQLLQVPNSKEALNKFHYIPDIQRRLFSGTKSPRPSIQETRVNDPKMIQKHASNEFLLSNTRDLRLLAVFPTYVKWFLATLCYILVTRHDHTVSSALTSILNSLLICNISLCFPLWYLNLD